MLGICVHAQACWKNQIVACVICADIKCLKYYTMDTDSFIPAKFYRNKYQQLELQLTNRKVVVDHPTQESPN